MKGVNIVDAEVADNIIKIVTDHKTGRTEFVYPVDKFKNLTELKREIERSVANEALRKNSVDAKIKNVREGLMIEENIVLKEDKVDARD